MCTSAYIYYLYTTASRPADIGIYLCSILIVYTNSAHSVRTYIQYILIVDCCTVHAYCMCTHNIIVYYFTFQTSTGQTDQLVSCSVAPALHPSCDVQMSIPHPSTHYSHPPTLCELQYIECTVHVYFSVVSCNLFML